MSRRVGTSHSGKPIRDMTLPTIADLRGAVAEAHRAVAEARAAALDAEQSETFCDQDVDQCRRLRLTSIGWMLLIGLVQVALLIVQGVLMVTR